MLPTSSVASSLGSCSSVLSSSSQSTVSIDVELSDVDDEDRLDRVEEGLLCGADGSGAVSSCGIASATGCKSTSESRTVIIELRGRGTFSGQVSTSLLVATSAMVKWPAGEK